MHSIVLDTEVSLTQSMSKKFLFVYFQFYEDMDQVTLFRTIVEEKYYPLPDDVSDDAYELIDHLLEKDPVHRMGSLAGGGKDILNSKWMLTLDLVKVRQKRVKAPFVPKPMKLSTVLEASGSGDSLLDDD